MHFVSSMLQPFWLLVRSVRHFTAHEGTAARDARVLSSMGEALERTGRERIMVAMRSMRKDFQESMSQSLFVEWVRGARCGDEGRLTGNG